MKVITQVEQVDAKLLAQGQEWPMLKMLPDRHVNFPGTMQEHVFQFLVVVEGFAQPVIVSRNGFAIVPLLESMKLDVNYVVDDDKEEPSTEKDIVAVVRESIEEIKSLQS